MTVPASLGKEVTLLTRVFSFKLAAMAIDGFEVMEIGSESSLPAPFLVLEFVRTAWLGSGDTGLPMPEAVPGNALMGGVAFALLMPEVTVFIAPPPKRLRSACFCSLGASAFLSKAGALTFVCVGTGGGGISLGD